MGRDRIIPLVVHEDRDDSVENWYAWDSKSYGRPNAANLRQHILDSRATMVPGGINAHLANTDAARLPRSATIVRQRTGETVCSIVFASKEEMIPVVRKAWADACAWDNIDPAISFAVFSSSNPLERAYNEAMALYLQAART